MRPERQDDEVESRNDSSDAAQEGIRKGGVEQLDRTSQMRLQRSVPDLVATSRTHCEEQTRDRPEDQRHHCDSECLGYQDRDRSADRDDHHTDKRRCSVSSRKPMTVERRLYGGERSVDRDRKTGDRHGDHDLVRIGPDGHEGEHGEVPHGTDHDRCEKRLREEILGFRPITMPQSCEDGRAAEVGDEPGEREPPPRPRRRPTIGRGR